MLGNELIVIRRGLLEQSRHVEVAGCIAQGCSRRKGYGTGHSSTGHRQIARLLGAADIDPVARAEGAETNHIASRGSDVCRTWNGDSAGINDGAGASESALADNTRSSRAKGRDACRSGDLDGFGVCRA